MLGLCWVSAVVGCVFPPLPQRRISVTDLLTRSHLNAPTWSTVYLHSYCCRFCWKFVDLGMTLDTKYIYFNIYITDLLGAAARCPHVSGNSKSNFGCINLQLSVLVRKVAKCLWQKIGQWLKETNESNWEKAAEMIHSSHWIESDATILDSAFAALNGPDFDPDVLSGVFSNWLSKERHPCFFAFNVFSGVTRPSKCGGACHFVKCKLGRGFWWVFFPFGSCQALCTHKPVVKSLGLRKKG